MGRSQDSRVVLSKLLNFHWFTTARSKAFVFLVIICFLVLLHDPWHPFERFLQHCRSYVRPLDASITYAQEELAWTPCGQVKNRSLECSSIHVPMDHFNATSPADKTFMIPIIRSRGLNATLNILFNPGGPGGSGIGLLYAASEELREIVGEDFHIVSFDPRGVNGSQPRAECYPDEVLRREHQWIHDGRRLDDAKELYAWAANFGKACADALGEHGKYINTPQTAADMNSILDSLGQRDMIYYGFSYGTLLGQTYASLFPERSKRIIIDGVVNTYDWYNGHIQKYTLEDTDRVFNGFFEECAKAGPSSCALASVDKTASDLKSDTIGLLAEVEEHPLDIYVNSTQHGVIFRERMIQVIFSSLYAPAAWPALADQLAQLLAGNATEFFLKYGHDDVFDVLGDSNSFVKINDGLSGVEHWPRSRDAFLGILRPFWEESLFAPTQGRTYILKRQWQIPRTHNFTMPKPGSILTDGKSGIRTAHPLLILSASFDPVCPISGARAASEVFLGSRIVELKAYGHCSNSMPSQCIARRVKEYLVNGTLPENHVACEVDAPYFPPPQQDAIGEIPPARTDSGWSELVKMWALGVL